jgi:putative ABC transport system permease protein
VSPHPILRIAWRNVRRHWRHSFGSLLSIVVGFVAIALFEGYLDDLRAIQAQWYSERSMMGHVMIEKRGASSRLGRDSTFDVALPRASQDLIDQFLDEHASEVKARNRALALGGLASNGRAGLMFVGWAYDPAGAAAVRGRWAWNVTAGVPLQNAPANAVLVGNTFAGLLDCTLPETGQAVGPDGLPVAAERPFDCRQRRLQLTATTESGQLNAIDPTIVGTFDAGLKDMDAKFVHLPLALGQRLLDTDLVSFNSVTLKDARNIDPFVAQLNAAAAARGVDVQAMRWDEHKYAELYRRGMQILGLYRTFVILIVVAIAGMSVFSTMLKAVNERVREIGTLRSLGYRRRHIGALFTVEAAMLSGVASCVGLLLSGAVVAAINGGGFSYNAGLAAQAIPLTVSLLPGVCVFAAVFLSAVAVCAAALPARRAARLGIPDALGHAG